MDFFLDTRFVVGLLAGAIIYHLWTMKRAAGQTS
jgi:hypothetical protein